MPHIQSSSGSLNYEFDDIGNLTTQKAVLPQMQFDYTTNIVNQYTQRTVPGIIPIVGKASADAVVSVKLPSRGTAANAITRATRYPSVQPGETYFVAPVAVDNTSASVTEQLDINAIKYDPVQDK